MSLTGDDDQLQPRQAYGPAEVDDGTHGIHAIPAMLRLLRSHLVTHTDAVTKSRDRVNSVLSTVFVAENRSTFASTCEKGIEPLTNS